MVYLVILMNEKDNQRVNGNETCFHKHPSLEKTWGFGRVYLIGWKRRVPSYKGTDTLFLLSIFVNAGAVDCSDLCSNDNDQLLENKTFQLHSLHAGNNPWHSDLKKDLSPFWFEYYFPVRDVTYECVLFLDSLSWKLLCALCTEQPQRMEVAFYVRHLFLALLMEFL